MKKNRGFTLIELLVVVAIIAILAAIALPNYLNQTRKARRNAAKASIGQIALLEERYRADNPSYLASTGNWSQLGGDPSGTYFTYIATVAAGPPATYTITATAQGDQLNDKANGTACSPLVYSIDTSGVISKTPTSCWGQ